MKLFELADKNGDAIRAAGARAISRLKAKGVAAHYLDASVGTGIIEELPDGRRYSLDSSIDVGRLEGRTAKAAPRPLAATEDSSLRRMGR